jgi:acyl transferase domain-containing protein
MGRELLEKNQTFRAKIEEIDTIFKPLAGWSLTDEMALPESESRIHLTEVAQPMLFAQQMGVTAMLAEAAIKPAGVFGHSVGEVAAACASGALTLEQATKVIFYRSEGQSKTAGLGKMAALGLSAELAEDAIAAVGGWLEVAAINGPDAVTVAGEETAIDAIVDKVTADGHFARKLKLDYPFHTKAMDQIRSDLLSLLEDLTPNASTVPFISTVTGEEKPGESLGADYWFDNVRQPVEFHGAVRSMLDGQDISLFLEIGPHPVLKDYVAQTARSEGSSTVALATLRRPKPEEVLSDIDAMQTVIAAAHAHGSTDLKEVFDRPNSIPDLPTYAWQRSRHWRGGSTLPDAFAPMTKVHPLLGARLPRNDGLWESTIDKNHLAYLKDHVIQGSVLFPAAGYLELSLSSAMQQ